MTLWVTHLSSRFLWWLSILFLHCQIFLSLSSNIAHFIYDSLNHVKKDPLLSFYLEYIQILLSRRLSESIFHSRKIVETFVRKNLPGHITKPVRGDRYCIIHAFHEKVLSIGCKARFDDLKTCLQNKLQSKKY